MSRIADPLAPDQPSYALLPSRLLCVPDVDVELFALGRLSGHFARLRFKVGRHPTLFLLFDKHIERNRAFFRQLPIVLPRLVRILSSCIAAVMPTKSLPIMVSSDSNGNDARSPDPFPKTSGFKHAPAPFVAFERH